MKKYTEHIVAAMDKSGVQKCLRCGQTVLDYRNACQINVGTGIGFAAGKVYLSEDGGKTSRMPGNAKIIECTNQNLTTSIKQPAL